MKQVTLRFLYPSSVPLQHVLAAHSGLESFKRFGALAERVCSEENRAFDAVKNPRILRPIASASGDLRLDKLPRSFIDQINSDLGFTTVFGIAITPYCLTRRYDMQTR